MRAFTLIELQLSLLLAVLVCALLLLFSGMFWSNFQRGRELSIYRRDALIFRSWLEKRSLEALRMESGETDLVLVGRYEEFRVRKTEQGPAWGEVVFFHEPVDFELQHTTSGHWAKFQLLLKRRRDGLESRFYWVSPLSREWSREGEVHD